MNKSKQFSSEVRERAVRLVQEHRGEYPSLCAAVESIAPKIGCVPQTLLECQARGICGACHPRMGLLVQRPPANGAPHRFVSKQPAPGTRRTQQN